ncbi:MAG: hypothetical protein H8E13_01720 [Actinobacteria bacterium]|nr:hypothetical protein [Actinomycetota bacterium]
MKAKEIKENYDILENYVEMFFDEERKKKVLKVFDHFQNRIIIAPASYKKEYHSAFPGGFLSHTINVIKNAVKLYKV